MGPSANADRGEFDDASTTRLRVALGRTVRGLDRRTNRDDVPRTQMTVLFTIANAERIAVAELAEFEAINPTMLSRILGKLEDKGLVRRIPDAVDRRIAHVEITPEGTRSADHQRAVRARIYTDVLSRLPPDDRAALLAALPALEALAELVYEHKAG